MENIIEKIIKRFAAQIRFETKNLEIRYNYLCPIMDRVIIKNNNIKLEDVQQHQWDMRKELWEVAFEEDYKKYKKLLKYINDYSKKDDGTI